jgi:hypothetical protein
MSKKKLTTPILINVNDILYKLIYINFSNDGSIYVYFPRKKGYSITKEVNFPDVIVGKQTYSLLDIDSGFNNPYISFHPRKKVIHINTQQNQIYKIDVSILNLAEDKDILAFSLCQIIFPSFQYLDEYSNSKYISPYIMNAPSLELNGICLGIEIWVHPTGKHIDIRDTPNFEQRRRDTKIVDAKIFCNKKLSNYTCTLLISEINCSFKKVSIPGVIVAIQGNEKSYSFQLNP